MELHQLRSVVAIAETGNFTRAAERCGITQPSLSQQIKILEGELGHKLFHRLGRKTVLTEAGQVFLERARSILLEVENASKELRDSPGLGRTIVVGATPSLAPYLLPRVIELCWERYPNLVIHTREDFRSGLIQAVVDGDLDLAVASMPIKDPRLAVEILRDEPLRLVVKRGHPLATLKEVAIEELAQEVFILLGESNSLSGQIQRFFGDHNFKPRIHHHCSQIKTVKALVAAGAGISILPRVAQEAADDKDLTYRKLSGRAPHRELALIRHQLRYQSRGAQQFIAVLKETMESDVFD